MPMQTADGRRLAIAPTVEELESQYEAAKSALEIAERAHGRALVARGLPAIRVDGGWTRDLILTRLDRVYRAAFLDRKWPSAIRALELAGYEFGMFTKRVELDSFSEDHLRRIAEKAGLTLEQLRDAQSFLEAEVLND